MNGYGPSLLDQGYSASDVEDLYLEQAEAWWRRTHRTGWALPDGKVDDYRVFYHYFSDGTTSVCGKWPTPHGSDFTAAPVNGQACSVCCRKAPACGLDLPPDFPR